MTENQGGTKGSRGDSPESTSTGGPRMLTLTDVAEVLNTSLAQVTALVRRGELRAFKLGGRGQWRVEAVELEKFIQEMYRQTEQHLQETNQLVE